MSEFIIENGIVIDDMDGVIEGIRQISGQPISDAETIRKFITSEKATKFYIDQKCTGKMQPDRDTVYLWLDSGFTDPYGNSIMISLLGDNYGGYHGHYFGTMDALARNIKSYFPRNSRDIARNLANLKNKYNTKIADRHHRHIDNEQEYLIMLCNSDAGTSEFESLINNLGLDFEDLAKEPAPAPEEPATPAEPEIPDFHMTTKGEEITVSLLLDTIDNMQSYINELLGELKKSNEDKEKLLELEQKNKDLEQALVDIRSFGASSTPSTSEGKEPSPGHDLLGRRGKILVLGATTMDDRTMQGIAKTYGFKKEDFDFMVDYDKISSFTGRGISFDKYSALILGACPHKVQNLGDWSSLIEKCKSSEGMPLAIDARSRSGELKVTKESFKQALLEICRELKG